jgi:dihydropteridine reductase
VSRYLSREKNMMVIGADVLELPNESDWELDDFVPLPHFRENPSLADLTSRLVKGVGICLGGKKLDCLVVASGGWQMDPTIPPAPDDADATHLHIVQDAARVYGESMERMMRMNYYPVAAAGYVAQEFMGLQGLFVVIGATAALSPTPGMLGYGVSKAAAHYFVQTLGATTGLGVAHKSLRDQGKKVRRRQEYLDSLTVIGILPTMLDTATNRASNPTLDFDQCTKPLEIAKEIGTWVSTPAIRPHSGSLIKVFTNPNEGTQFHLVR